MVHFQSISAIDGGLGVLTPGDLLLCARLAEDPLDVHALQDLQDRVKELAPMLTDREAEGLRNTVDHFTRLAALARAELEAERMEAGMSIGAPIRVARLDVLEAMVRRGELSTELARLGNDLAARLLAGAGAKAAPALDYAAIRVDGGRSHDWTGPKGWDGLDAKIWREAVQPLRGALASRPVWSLTSDEVRKSWDSGDRTPPKGRTSRVMALVPVESVLKGGQITVISTQTGVHHRTLKKAIIGGIALYSDFLRSTDNLPLDLIASNKV